MLVRQGWTGEVQENRWAKIDVELDEGDLGRLLREAGITAPTEGVPLLLAYSLLEVEAERLVLMKLIIRHGYSKEQGSRELSEFEQSRTALIGQIRSVVHA